jgi:phosphoribosylformimino-5-aminoimidazole carboxamide ribotide isomerase
MIVFPAIDLKDGMCVRLRQGDMAQSTVFNDNAAAQARSFEAAGFQWLHVVDLNGAVAGASVNSSAVRGILDSVNIPVQLGGGIREPGTIEAWLSAGVARVILGTAAVRDPALVSQSARQFPGRIAVGIDARDGRVAVDGWTRDSGMAADELARRYEDAGIAAIIFTDIARDGMLQGVNVEATAALASAVSIPVIASGGVSNVADIRRLKSSGAPIAGVVIGRALYDGRIDPAGALSAAGREPAASD